MTICPPPDASLTLAAMPDGSAGSFKQGGAMKLHETITAENWDKTMPNREDAERGCVFFHMTKVYEPGAWGLLVLDLDRAIAALYPERTMWKPEFGISVSALGCFNDHKDTTLEDVLRVCKFADV